MAYRAEGPFMRGPEGAPSGEPSLTVVTGASAGVLRAIIRSTEIEEQLRVALGGHAGITLDLGLGSVVETQAIIPGAPRPAALLVDVDLGDPSQLLALRKMV